MPTRTATLLQQALVVAAFVGLWELLVRAGALDPVFFPPPTEVARRLCGMVGAPETYRNLRVTLFEMAAGFLIGTAGGVAAGLYLGLHAGAERLARPFLAALNAIPRVTLAPVFGIWFGLGPGSKIALAVTLVFFTTFFATFQGVREVPAVQLDNVRMLGARPVQLLRHVYLPYTASWILFSLRSSVGFAVVGAIIGEYVGSSAGMGHMIAEAEGTLDSTGVFAGIALLSLLVVTLNGLLSLVEKRLIAWREQPGAQASGLNAR